MKINVMTFNIRGDTPTDGPNQWAHRRELVFNICQQHAPDVMGMQEPLPHQFSELCAALPDYEPVGRGRSEGGPENEYSPIFFRRDRFAMSNSGTFWLSDTPETPESRSWGNSLPRICTWARLVETSSGLAFYIYNTHLDHESQPARERSVQLIKERIAARLSADPVIVTGDFNAEENNSAIRAMKDAASAAPVDTFRALHPHEPEVYTFHGFRGSRVRDKIDYIFGSPEWQVVTAEIVRTAWGSRYPSDHFPVMAVLEL